MLWIHAINETAAVEFAEGVMNPMSPDKIRTLGRRLRLRSGQHILDVGAGRCGPAIILAREFGCRVTAVEPYEGFVGDARRRVHDAGLADRFRFAEVEAQGFEVESGAYDVCMCLGATWAWGGLGGTLDALVRGARDGGHVVAGEPYRQDPPFAAPGDDEYLPLAEVVERFESRGLNVVTLIRSSADDWDTYNSIQTISLLEWLEAHPNHAEADTVRRWRAEAAQRLAEPPIGWAIVAGRKAETR